MTVYEGTIITCDKNNSVFRFLVEDKGRIEYTGDNLPEKYSRTDRVNLGRRILLPSFTDTHLHFSSYAVFSSTVDVRHARDNRELADILKQYANTRKVPFVLAFGASSHSVTEKRLVTKEELDRALPEIPVMIIKYDGHASICNSAMLSALPQRVAGLRGYHASSGELNQEAFFAATDFITKKIPPLTLLRNMNAAYDRLAVKGIGCIHTVEGVGFPRDLDVDTARFVARGQRSGFQTRVFFQTMDERKVLKRKLPRIGGCFATALDGCFGSKDAALNQPYRDDSSNRGILFYDQDTVDAFCDRANRAGLQIELHAIGDAAFDQASTAIQRALVKFPRKDHRYTIIHACLPTDRGLDICAANNIGIAAQSAFLDWNLEPDEYLESILGDRARRILPLREFVKRGIRFSFGSDAPCTIPDPIEWLHKSCNHPVAEQSISVEEAIRALTIDSAWTGFDEIERGTLEVGKIADMVILSDDPFKVRVDELRSIKTDELILGGQPYMGNQGLLSAGLYSLSHRKSKV